MKQRVLFLCTGNSARSQMAEAIVNARLGDSWEAYSAGTKPAGFVHPTALAVLKQIGIQHTGRSKSIEEFKGMQFDLVITVCDSAAEECPIWLGQGRKIHIGFPDPAFARGNINEIQIAFENVRDGIEKKIIPLLQDYQS
jgi:arsenate reductase (thioredoxin)